MTETKIAARFYAPNKPLVLEEVHVPQIGSEEVLVEVKACGLCGSDIHMFKGETPTGKRPITFGHEIAGVIAKKGESVENWQVGDRVVISCVTSCGYCYNCQRGRDGICVNRVLVGIHVDGGLARYVKIKPRNLVSLPDEIPFEQGALLTDAVATPYHAIKARANLRSGESVAIFGVGGLGVHAVKLARLLGAAPIIALDISDSKLDRAKLSGADEVVNVTDEDPIQAIRSLTKGLGVDVAVECVGSPQTVRWAAEAVAIGGRAVVVGHSPDLMQLMDITGFVRKEVTLMGSSGFELKEINQLTRLTASGRLDLSQSVTENYPLKKVNEALVRLAQGAEDVIRLVINSF